jgi:hypothetical protein
MEKLDWDKIVTCNLYYQKLFEKFQYYKTTQPYKKFELNIEEAEENKKYPDIGQYNREIIL